MEDNSVIGTLQLISLTYVELYVIIITLSDFVRTDFG